MFYTNVCLFLLLCSKTIHFESRIIFENERHNRIKDINKHIAVKSATVNGITGNSKNPFLEISFSLEENNQHTETSHNYFIYTNNLSFYENSENICKIYVLDTCINCEIAFWTKNSLFNLIKTLPSLAQTDFVESKNNEELMNDFKSTFENKFQNISKIIDKCINILNYFTIIQPSVVSSSETIVLESLYSVKLKIFYYTRLLRKKFKNKEIIAYQKSDSQISRDFLITINALRSFLTTNCKDKYNLSEKSSEDRQRFFDFSLNFKKLDNIEIFFKRIQFLNYEKFPQCSIEQMLLSKFIMMGHENNTPELLLKISKEINRAMYADDKTGKSDSIRAYFSRIDQSSDIFDVFTYMKAVLNTLVVMIHHKFKTSLLSEEINLNVHTKLYFKGLAEKLELSINQKNIVRYLNLFVISINKDGKDKSKIVNEMTAYYEKEITSVSWSTSNEDLTLEIFLDEITREKYENDFLCFGTFFEFLQNIHERYYVPFLVDAKNLKNIRQSSDTHQHTNNRCKYVDNMFGLCLKVSFYINIAESFKQKDGRKKNYTKKVCYHFDEIKKCFLKMIENKTKDINILKIAYNAVIILVNANCSEKEEMYIDNYQRVVYSIMIELNDYYITFCDNSSDLFILNKNANFNDDGNIDVIKKNISETLNVTVKNLDRMPVHTHFDIKYLYSQFIKKSKVITKYRDIVKMYWKGEVRKFDEIYTYAVSSLTLNSRFLYQFFDVFFKFFIGALYYEIFQYGKFVKWHHLTDTTEFKSLVRDFPNNSFPKALQPLINDLKNYAIYSLETKFNSVAQESYSIYIDNELKNSLIEVETRGTRVETRRLCMFRFSESDEDHIKLINKDASDIVSNVLECFKLLQIQNS